ncbi:putative LysR-family transcriptional regulator [Frankia canadensis]|uniref:Putative LysR-family transcriptional regulator n=2 Tax=Frankia canadensis TaxID=1836972 RepID=A0A2I2KZT4_9ACTN|nr:LysR family transcriptional regulator [Frankia canadensis]SNQ51165.1 putative LysR-family transcriptional regulator [Frankia canadensis]SOU58455.1 putative LysR-family transcriptional regulator [Frankia canadensis]
MHAMQSVADDVPAATPLIIGRGQPMGRPLAGIDLNLLVTLDVLLAERSVSGAARRLHLTEPAVSRALGRIRRAIGDQILVRSGNTMLPTPRALAIQAEVRDLVARAHGVFAPVGQPDLSTLERTFTILSSDMLVASIAVDLLDRLTAAAPAVRVRFLPEPMPSADPLRDGTADLEIGQIDSTATEIRVEALGEDAAVAVVRAGHPLTRGPLTPERLADGRHVIASRRGRVQGPLDAALAAHGLRRTVAVTVPSHTVALSLVAQSDLIGIAPRRLGRVGLASAGLVALDLDLDLPTLPVCLAWHPRYDADGPHRWLRAHVRTAITTALRSSSWSTTAGG